MNIEALLLSIRLALCVSAILFVIGVLVLLIATGAFKK